MPTDMPYKSKNNDEDEMADMGMAAPLGGEMGGEEPLGEEAAVEEDMGLMEEEGGSLVPQRENSIRLTSKVLWLKWVGPWKMYLGKGLKRVFLEEMRVLLEEIRV